MHDVQSTKEFSEAADEIAKDNKDQFSFFGKVNVAQESKLTSRFKIDITPQIVWFV